MHIPDEKIEEVRSATDIVDIVGDYVQLKRRGSNFVGLCPFHNEKTPSFNVNPSLGIFKCFGCGVGGDVFQFLMGTERISFPEAVRMLAERAGVLLPDAEAGPDERSSAVESIYHALRFAARFFFHQLTQTEEGKVGLDYLRGRGFTPKTIKQFGLGYAPDAWDALLRAAAESHIAPETLEQAGLVIPRKDGSGYYDRYRGRVIFPIFSHVGKVLGFGGRILRSDVDQPKYINSPETEVYSKSRILYGLYQGKQEIRRSEEVILVEGYTDVISLHQAGVENVVASSGTALTVEQVRAIGRYAKRVLLLYDADAAGAGAALRGIDLILQQGLIAYAVALPPGDDPDSYVREHGADAFRAYVQKHRQDFVSFKHAQAKRAGALDTPEGQAAVIHEILASVALIPDKLVRDAYVRHTGEVVREPDITLFKMVDGIVQARRSSPGPEPVPTGPAAGPAAGPGEAPPEGDAASAGEERWLHGEAAEPTEEEKMLLQLMLEYGTPMVEHILGKMSLDEFTVGPTRDMAERLVALYQQGEVTSRPFLNGQYGQALRDLAASLLMPKHQISDNWRRKLNIDVASMGEQAYPVADAVFKKHRKKLTLQTIEQVRHQIFLAGKDEAKVEALTNRLIQLFAYLKELDPQLAVKAGI